METHETEIPNKETLTNPNDAPSPSLNTTYYPPKYSTAQTEDVRTPEQGGTTCVGVRGITGDGLPSKVIYRQVMFHIRNMQVLKTSHRIAIQQFSREQLLEMVEIYDLIMKNVNYLFD
jgi:hypothetical protein